VLPICIGQATKVVPFLTDTQKKYIAELKLGSATETEDSYGETIKETEVDHFPSDEEIDLVLQSFHGEVTQIPTMYSAVKVKGKKLYEYARANETVERPKRQVNIFHIEKIDKNPDNQTIRFEVVCSKGTYIRTLCVDIGEKLGYPAHMSFLKRTKTGNYTEEDAITFEKIEKAVGENTYQSFLQPMITAVDHLDKLYVDEETKRKIANGQKLLKPVKLPNSNPFLMMYEEELLAIYQLHPK